MQQLHLHSGVGREKFRDVKPHGVAGGVLHDAGEVGGRDVQLVGIEGYVVVLPVVLDQQFSELAVYLARPFDIDRRVTVVLYEDVGRLQQQEAAQMVYDAVGIEFETLQFVSEEGKGLLQISALVGFQGQEGEPVSADKLGQLVVEGLSSRLPVEVFGGDVDAGKLKVAVHFVDCGFQAGGKNKQHLFFQSIAPMGIGDGGCSIFDENKKESLSNSQTVVARKPSSIAKCSGLRDFVQGVEEEDFHLGFSTKVTTVSFLTKIGSPFLTGNR